MRLMRSLAGNWGFQLDPQGELQYEAIQPDREIIVPMPWQAVFPELQQYSGYAWYQRTFELSEEWLSDDLLLDFGAVDYWCQVYINRHKVGEHEGGYTPFRLPIREFVHSGENILRVRVYDTVQDSIVISRWRDDPAPDNTAPPFDPQLIPHGKQTWYIDASGIWQDVKLTAVPSQYIDRVHVTPEIDTGKAQIKIRLGGAADAGTLRATIGELAAETKVAPGQTEVTLTIQVPQPALWTPDTPVLYTVEVELETEHSGDQLAVRFGFREITTRDGYLLLNGEPIYLLCALDQDLYPDTIYTVPSDEFLRDQFQKAKELGLNSLRCHIKPPDPRYLDLADEIGLLIWAEIPSWRTFYPKATIPPGALYLDETVKLRVRDTLTEMIERDYNHPSLMIWTIVNEDWGTALLLSEADRAWIVEMVDYCKQLDPTRLVVDNSPCPAPWGLSVHTKTDLDDFHIYTNIPDSARHFEQFVEQFAQRPLWSFSNTGDAQRTGQEPLVLSEFGNWGMPSLKRYENNEPGWFHSDGWWSPWNGEAGYPANARQRFEQLGLGDIWPDYEAFAEATQWHEFHALKFEIEALRRQSAIQGYVITELSDIYWESNGLLDFARGPKVFHQRFGHINAEDLIIPHLSRYTYWDDETAEVGLYVSHYSSTDWANIEARATAQGQNVFEAALHDMARGEVRYLGDALWQMSSTEREAAAAMLELRLERDSTLSENEVTVLLLPSAWRQAVYGGKVAIMTRRTADISAFRDAVQSLGYHTSAELSANTDLLITDSPTSEMLAWVRAGGDMLYLSSGSAGSPFFWQDGRSGTYGGNWISSFNWLRPPFYRRLAVGSPLSLPFMDVIPGNVILGLPMTDPAVHQDFLAGQITGWVHHPAAHTVQFRYGNGRVIMTTFRIKETISYQPISIAMLHDLVEHLTSDACQPMLKANYL